jgi:nitroreductase
MSNTLVDIFEKRHTTFAWDEERIPEKELVLEALREVHTHIPSKNLQFPYQVRLMRNDDPAIRKQIMAICQRNMHMTVEEDHGNPQVLAPWLIGFNARFVADLERRYEPDSVRGVYDGEGKGKLRTNDDHGAQTQTENIEIGIFSAYIMLALANRGIQTGMCANICINYEEATEIFNLAEDEKALDFRFIMGIGYGKDIETRHNYLDPRIDTEKPIPFAPVNVEDVYPRPSFDDIIIQL